jgi:hypothetical protein
MGLGSRMVCTPHLVPPKKKYVSPTSLQLPCGFELPSCVALFLDV